MKNLIQVLLYLSVFALAGCAPKDGPTSASGGVGTPAGGGPSAPVANGTGSVGGGGNGIDNKMLESFSIRIDTLPEFKRYIQPVIRKIARGRGDILTAYMNYAIHDKPWYMIPRPLENLSKEQIGTAFPTDQFALHSDERVYLAKAFYDKMNQKERANLLMHEIVMGARLLMKKTPKDQCEKLAGAQVQACSDPEMMKLAEAQDISDSQRGTMDEQDHDAVKAMTIFLMQRTEDVTAESVTTKRRELGFIFPWDKAISNLTFGDLGLALQSEKLSGVELKPVGYRALKTPIDLSCPFDLMYNSGDDSLQLNLFVADKQQYVTTKDMQAAEKDEWANVTPTIINTQVSNSYTAVFEKAMTNASADDFEARGVIDPTNPKRVVDYIRLRPHFAGGMEIYNAANSPAQYPIEQIEIWLTREQDPQIVQVTVRPLKILIKGNPDYSNIAPDDWKFVEAKKEQFRCVP